MKIDILTLFPEMFVGPLNESIIKRAREKKLVDINIHYLRKWADDKHKTVDDRPYGGGAGMVIRVDIVARAISSLQLPVSKKKSKIKNRKSKIILLSPQGKVYTQKKAKELAKIKHLILIAGHYEGFDERIREHLIDEEISIGDYVLTGGEIPAMAVVDSVVRLLPKVLGDKNSLKGETHSVPGTVKHPVYTRPEEFNGWKVPKVLLSGNHKEIEKWRKKINKR